MLAIPIEKLLQRMDELEEEYFEYVNRWRVLRATLEEEAAQQITASDGAKVVVHKHDFSQGLHCSVCGEAQF